MTDRWQDRIRPYGRRAAQLPPAPGDVAAEVAQWTAAGVCMIGFALAGVDSWAQAITAILVTAAAGLVANLAVGVAVDVADLLRDKDR